MANKPKAPATQPINTRELRQREASEPAANASDPKKRMRGDTAPPTASSNRRKKTKVPDEDVFADDEPEVPSRKRITRSKTPAIGTRRSNRVPGGKTLPQPDDLEPLLFTFLGDQCRLDSVVEETMPDYSVMPTTEYSMPSQDHAAGASYMPQFGHGYHQLSPFNSPFSQVSQVSSAHQLAPQVVDPYQLDLQVNGVFQQGTHSGDPYQQVFQGDSEYQQVPQVDSASQQSPRLNGPHQQVPRVNSPYQRAPQVNSPFQQVPQITSPYQQVSQLDRKHVSAPLERQASLIGQDSDRSVLRGSPIIGRGQLGPHGIHLRASGGPDVARSPQPGSPMISPHGMNLGASMRQNRTTSSVGFPSPSPTRSHSRLALPDRSNTSPMLPPSMPLRFDPNRTPILRPMHLPGSPVGSMRTEASPTRHMPTRSPIPSFEPMQSPRHQIGRQSSSNEHMQIGSAGLGPMLVPQGFPLRSSLHQVHAKNPEQSPYIRQKQQSPVTSMQNKVHTNNPIQSPLLRHDQGSPVRSTQNQGFTSAFLQSPLRQGQAMSGSHRLLASIEKHQEPSSGSSPTSSVASSQMSSPGPTQRAITSHQSPTFGQVQDSSSGSNRAISVGPSHQFSYGQNFFRGGRARAASNTSYRPSLLGLHQMTHPDQMSPPAEQNLPTLNPDETRPFGPARRASTPSPPQGNTLLSPFSMQSVLGNMTSTQDNMSSTQGILSTTQGHETPFPSFSTFMPGQMSTLNQGMVAPPKSQLEPTPQLDVGMGLAIDNQLQNEDAEGSAPNQQLQADAAVVFALDFDDKIFAGLELLQDNDGSQPAESQGLGDAPPPSGPEPTGQSAAQQPTREQSGDQQANNPQPVPETIANPTQTSPLFPIPGQSQLPQGQYNRTQLCEEHTWCNELIYGFMSRLIANNRNSILPANKSDRVLVKEDLDKMTFSIYRVLVQNDNTALADRFSRFCGSFSHMQLATLAHLNVLPAWWLIRLIVKGSLTKAGYLVDDQMMMDFFVLAGKISQEFWKNARSAPAGGPAYAGLAAVMAAERYGGGGGGGA